MSGIEWLDSAARAEILSLLSNILDQQNSGFVIAVTWAEAAAMTLTDGTGVKIYGPDAGTHLEPDGVATVANTGTFQYRTAGVDGLYRVADLELIPPIRFNLGEVAVDTPLFDATEEMNDGLTPGDSDRTTFHGFNQRYTVDATNQLVENNLHTAHRWMLNGKTIVQIGLPTRGAFPGGLFGTDIRFVDLGVVSGKAFGSIGFFNGSLTLNQGTDYIVGRPQPLLQIGYDDFNSTTGWTGPPQVAILSCPAEQRLQLQVPDGAMVLRFGKRLEIECPSATDTRIPVVGYYTADGKIIEFVNSGQPNPRCPFAISTVDVNADIMMFGTKIANLTRTNKGKIDPLGVLYVPSIVIGSLIGDEVMTGASAVAPVTQRDLQLTRVAASVLKVGDGAGGFGAVRAKLQTETAATVGAVTPTVWLKLYDSAGTAYKVAGEII